MDYLLETYFQWPVLPFSILLCAVTVYWCMVILGGIDLDVIDIDFDLDLDPDITPSVTDLGMLGLRWLNIGEVPFMVWMSIVAITSWVLAMIFDREIDAPTTGVIATSIVRNLGIGILTAKVLTNPLRGMLRFKQPNTIDEMIGRTCSIVTSEVNTKFGNAVCHVEDGAPLRLNVRTIEGTVPKNAIARIIDFSPETGIYYIEDTGERLS